MKPIYEPKGRAKEYGDLAINIYTGCPHRCYYCFGPNVLHRERERFYSVVEPRPGIVEATKEQIEREKITGKTIHLCFTCDPYPTGYDTTVTREIIKTIKEAGNHVQILTKGNGIRDFDLLDSNDWYGITYDGQQGGVYMPGDRLVDIMHAHKMGIKTWVSFEPVLDANAVLCCIFGCAEFFDKVKIGKLHYWKSDINWAEFGRKVEKLCQEIGLEYYIKDSLRAEMKNDYKDKRK